MKSINWGGKDVIDPRFLMILKDWIETGCLILTSSYDPL